MFTYILPILILALIVFCIFKKINVYNTFTQGVKKALPLIYSLFPYLCSIFIMTELFSVSGLSDKIIKLLSPVFNKIGIDGKLTPLIILKPFSGSGSLAILSDILSSCGADSYVGRTACCIYGSSETIFYVSAVYFARCKNKKLFTPILICLFSTFCSCIVACLLCKIM